MAIFITLKKDLVIPKMSVWGRPRELGGWMDGRERMEGGKGEDGWMEGRG